MAEQQETDLVWSTVQSKVSDLVPYEHNPRILDPQQEVELINSLKKFNLAEIPAINTNNTVVAGHQRLKIMIMLGRGDEIIDVREPNRLLTEEELKEYNVISNVPAGRWDVGKLGEAFADIDLTKLGLNVDEIPVPEPLMLGVIEDPGAEMEPLEKAITKVGDIYELTSSDRGITHRIQCGDSTDASSLAKLINGAKVDLVFADAPYGIEVVQDGMVGADFGVADKGQYSEIISDESTATARDFYKACVSLGLHRYILWGGNYFTDFLPFSDGWLVWNKRAGTGIRNTFADGEMAWCSFHTPLRIDDQLWNGMIREGEKDKRLHPTQKPVRMLTEIISDHMKGHILFEGFLGSGSILIACELLKRACYGQELSPRYVDVTVGRWVKYMIKNKLLYCITKNGKLLNEQQINEYSPPAS